MKPATKTILSELVVSSHDITVNSVYNLVSFTNARSKVQRPLESNIEKSYFVDLIIGLRLPTQSNILS